MKINNQSIVKRWNKVMNSICLEYLTINTYLSELADQKEYYQITDGITTEWLLEEAKYWLSCYYEEGNVRCDDRFYSKESYKNWVSESGKLKRLVNKLESMENCLIVEW